MAKQLRKVELNIRAEPDTQGEWQVKASADLTVVVEEYPEFERRKGIPITLTEAQETAIKNFVLNVVLPQAEINK